MSATAGARAGASAPDGALDPYFEHSRPEVRALVPPEARRVLDVGCGAGALGAALKAERGIEVVGLELVAEAARAPAERLDAVVEADLEALEALPSGLGPFDAMVFADVLEHLRDPHRLLRRLRPHLAAGGAVICSIPNVRHWSVLYPLLVQDRFTYAEAGLLDRTHLHLFTLEEIGAMLDDVGLRAESVGATEVALPDALRPMVQLAGAFGAEEGETAARMAAYQYLVVARG